MIKSTTEGYVIFKGIRLPLLILIILVLLRLVLLDAYPLMDSTEARFANIARRMVVSGDFITPQYLHGVPYWGKPPLSFWLTALSFEFFGFSDVAARLSSLLVSVGTVYLTFILSERLFGRSVAFLSAIVLSTTGLFWVLAGVEITDTFLTASITLSMVSFVMAMEGGEGINSRRWGYLFFAGLGLSLMTKGPVGFVLTLLPIGVWTLWKRSLRDVWQTLPCFGGIALMLVIAVPWYVLAEIKTPGFLRYFFIGENLGRFIIPGWKGVLYGTSHHYTRGTIWLFSLAATMPWVMILTYAAWELHKKGGRFRDVLKERWAAYLLCWYLTPMVFFTMCANILPTYVLPALPAFAIITSLAMHKSIGIVKNNRSLWFLRPRAVFCSIVFVPVLCISIALTVLPSMGARKSQKNITTFFQQHHLATNDELMYFGNITFSGEFYSNGKAKDIPDRSPEKVRLELEDDDREYFVVKTSELDTFTELAGNLVKEVAIFGKYVLLVEK